MRNNYIWIFGENNGNTANNNSYYFWKNVVDIDDGIDKYFILKKTSNNKKKYNTLNKRQKKFIVWKNSIKHYKLIQNADMLFVTLSYLDVYPTKVLNYKLNLKINAPVIYLQHGTLGIKKIGYKGNGYNNNFFRFCIYNKSIIETYKKENDFRDYQIYYSPYLPRYTKLLELEDKIKDKNQILWFITWRDYFKDKNDATIFLHYFKKVITSSTLTDYLEKNNLTFKVCVHSFFEDKYLKDIYPLINSKRIIIEKQDDINVMLELSKSKLLITDYSSIGFDFTFLNKPVLFFQPDIDFYLKDRELYCDVQELMKYNFKTSKELINKIVSEDYELNNFYKKRLPENIDYDYVRKGKHIIKMYNDFSKIQLNKITFLGYNFSGVGGTISATKALAEGLLEKNYLVQLLSLKHTKLVTDMPYGLNFKYIYSNTTKSKKIRLLRAMYKYRKHYKYIECDCNKKFLNPYSGYGLCNLLKKIKTNTLVSTRESLHLFLKDCASDKVKNKIYFFHTANKTLEEHFPGVLEELSKNRISKAIFVTEENMKDYKLKSNYSNYDKFTIIGNALEGSNTLNINNIKALQNKDKYSGVYLLRISKDRKDDIQNLINFGNYLKSHNIKNISIDVFGSGDYVDDFLDLIDDNDLYNYINYKGITYNIKNTLNKYDVLIDFSINNSFGMTYIEAILNGKKVFCMENTGSKEVLKNIPNSYITSYKDLCKKINSLKHLTKEELINNYLEIDKLYSRDVVANKFISFLENND